ncbi:hypothetical protein SGQ44_00585 [Flavobacterium sp. Fl-77]|uniref:Uncharacterized protein n=1 Tax=Flavobacterium flavipigmentatum TaxID=2893884 RepID=A0AAJ2VWK0_9FLAO|nr:MULTISPECIES: hypothetical protein [unclassified Flavobacterium]MDX6180629.1 hypothetical protein [Flavobacterium sp. Fl-33]MDX6184229.1 hypothetical protein [Flavobacterium sp. Fl-77]UFH39341.1 hypothetical protein LNP22_03485 [Flavobacterium sp. F-70]
MKTVIAKLKSVTVKELRIINENSTKAKFNATYDIDGLVSDGILSDIPDFAYNVQLCMIHPNQDGSMAMRVYVGTNKGFNPLIMDMTQGDYDGLFKMKFRVVA